MCGREKREIEIDGEERRWRRERKREREKERERERKRVRASVLIYRFEMANNECDNVAGPMPGPLIHVRLANCRFRVIIAHHTFA